MASAYPGGMSAVTEYASTVRRTIDARRDALLAVLGRYGATNPRLFGSVARGDARPGSDVDLFVDLDEGAGNPLLRVAGIGEELSGLLGARVDVVAESLLRDPVATSARRDMVPL